MMFLSILIVLLILLMYLLWMPILILIDTRNKLYSVQIHRIARIFLVLDELEILEIRVQVFRMNFRFFPLKMRSKSKKEIKKKKSSKKKRFNAKTGLQIIRSFRIRTFRMEVDSGDFVLNAKLYSLYGLVESRTRNVQINFQNRNSLLLILENRPLYILKSIINF